MGDAAEQHHRLDHALERLAGLVPGALDECRGAVLADGSVSGARRCRGKHRRAAVEQVARSCLGALLDLDLVRDRIAHAGDEVSRRRRGENDAVNQHELGMSRQLLGFARRRAVILDLEDPARRRVAGRHRGNGDERQPECETDTLGQEDGAGAAKSDRDIRREHAPCRKDARFPRWCTAPGRKQE
jgi:hypothetical protein